jgi:hypothetical protein
MSQNHVVVRDERGGVPIQPSLAFSTGAVECSSIAANLGFLAAVKSIQVFQSSD